MNPPILVTAPSYGGSLAAVRRLGRMGIDVTVAAPDLLSAGRWSRYATRVVHCPKIDQPERFLDWLVRFGSREPKHVLYATSDDMAYLMALHREELGRHFFLYQPSLPTVLSILDKKLLMEACASIGLGTVESWFPRHETDLQGMLPELPAPLLVKARTQVLRKRQTKGAVARRAADILDTYREFADGSAYFPAAETHWSGATQPMLQRFLPKAAESVWSVTGFIDESGEHHAARAARKVFQRTQPVGLGLCFEAAPLERSLLDAALRLCQKVGYFGVFEIEFLRDEGVDRVIDFNPRFFGQMGFDHARGLPLAGLAWQAATGRTADLHESLAKASQGTDSDSDATLFGDFFTLQTSLAYRRIGGVISQEEFATWSAWLKKNRRHMSDAFIDGQDPLPALMHVFDEVVCAARSFRRALTRRCRSLFTFGLNELSQPMESPPPLDAPP